MLRAVGSTDATVGGGKSRKSGRGAGNGKGPNAGGASPSMSFDPSNTQTNKVTLSNSNQTASRINNGGLGSMARGLTSKSSGKWYTEFFIDTSGGVGSTTGVGLMATGINLSPSGTNYIGGFDTVAKSWGYWADGKVYVLGTGGPVLATYTTGDVISLAWDYTAGKLWFAKNNVWIGSGDPATGANAAVTSALLTAQIWPGADCYSYPATISIRTPAQHSYSPPSGFSAWT